MADEEKKYDAMGDVWLFVGFLVILVALWYAAGGPGKADLRGLFIAPPQPLGSGAAYGPQIGSSTEQVSAPANDTSYTAPQY